MKKPELQFEPMWHVEDFTGKITQGMGILLVYRNDWYEEERVLFYPLDSINPLLTYKTKFFPTFAGAEVRSEQQKKRHREYYERQLKEAQEKLKII